MYSKSFYLLVSVKENSINSISSLLLYRNRGEHVVQALYLIYCIYHVPLCLSGIVLYVLHCKRDGVICINSSGMLLKPLAVSSISRTFILCYKMALFSGNSSPVVIFIDFTKFNCWIDELCIFPPPIIN